MSSESARLRWKSWFFAAFVIVCNVFGNFFLKWGLPSPQDAPLSTPLDYIMVLFRPWVAAGVLLLILWLLSRMALLSWADLSYVVPLTAAGYVLVALAGMLFLHEEVTVRHWSGIALIVVGVVLVGGGSDPQETPPGSHPAGAGR